MKGERVLGLDLSIVCTGIACLSPTAQPWTDVIRPPGPTQATLEARIAQIVDVVAAYTLKVHLVVIEGPAWNQITAAFKLGMVNGAVRDKLWRQGTPFVVEPPSLIKKFATGRGNAKKQEMLEAAQVRLPNITDHNVADAYWLAQWGLQGFDTLMDKAIVNRG